jgi:hypothetical protein
MPCSSRARDSESRHRISWCILALVAAKILQHSNRKTKVGRPTKYSLKLMVAIAKRVGKGMHLNEAGNRYRIPYPTVEQWAKDHVEFNDEIGYWQAVWLEKLLDKLYAGDNKDAQFLLERLHGARFADPRIGLQINLQQNNNIVPGLGLPEEVLAVLRAKLDAAGKVEGKPGVLNPGSALRELLNGAS